MYSRTKIYTTVYTWRYQLAHLLRPCVTHHPSPPTSRIVVKLHGLRMPEGEARQGGWTPRGQNVAIVSSGTDIHPSVRYTRCPMPCLWCVLVGNTRGVPTSAIAALFLCVCTGGGGIFRISYFKCVRNFPLNFQATVRNKPGAKLSHWGAFSLPLCSLAVELLSVGRGWRRPLKSGLPPWLEGVYTRTVNADVPGRGKGSGDSRIRVRDQGIPVNEGIGVCCAPKQIKGLVLDCLEPWGMGLRSRSCRNPLKVKNAILEAPGSSQNNPGTSWNLAVQGSARQELLSSKQYNSGRVRNFLRDFQATVRNKPGAKFSRAKNSRSETPPPPYITCCSRLLYYCCLPLCHPSSGSMFVSWVGASGALHRGSVEKLGRLREKFSISMNTKNT